MHQPMRLPTPMRTSPCAYRLDGATDHARARPYTHAHTDLVRGACTPRAFPTLLDKDWMALGWRLQLDPGQTASLMRTCAADAAFLARHACIDWSVLLGVVRRAAEGAAASAAPPRWQRTILGTNGDTYYIGIVDILERWRGCRWPLQSCVLAAFFRYVACSSWYNPDGITAVPPRDYSARFLEFMATQVVDASEFLPTEPDDPTQRYHKTWQPWW